MRLFSLAAIIGVITSLAPLRAQTTPSAPIAKQVEHRSIWHGETVNDPYFWLREKSKPEVIKYLEDENAYTAARTKEIEPFAQALYQEMLGHIKQTDLSAPARNGAYFYYSRTEEGKQYPIHCRKKAAADGSFGGEGPEEIILDTNALAQGVKFFSVGALHVSDDANLLAYSVDTTGYRQYRLYVKDLTTGVLLPYSAERVTSVEWCADNRTLFYTTEDPITKRSNMVWRHPRGEETEPVYREEDQLFSVHLGRSKDKKMIFLRSTSTDTWETRFLNSDQPQGTFQVVLARQPGHKYQVDHRGGDFYFRTNRDAKNFRLVTAPVASTAPQNWRELVPHRADSLLNSFELFQDHLVVSEKTAGLVHFRVLDFGSGRWQDVGFGESVYAASIGRTPEFASHDFRFQYQSMVTPRSTFDHNMVTGEPVLRKRQEVPDYNPDLYATERQWAVARDGVKVPLSLVYRRDVPKDGKAPLFLYGYGAYGSGISASFDSDRISLLDRGMIFAIAHVRGGDEMGEAWHDDGMLLKKKNSFEDFIACAEWLVANKWTNRDRLVIEGASAGGLLMGAVTNMQPGLFKAVHAGVPFVDVINTMFDSSLPLTVGEFLEWGNPKNEAAFKYMRSYSPYDNIERKAYPAILVTTSLNDSQVMYWEPTKYVARLRSQKIDTNPLLLKCNMGAGHGGASGRYDSLKETAFEYAWLMSQVGITK